MKQTFHLFLMLFLFVTLGIAQGDMAIKETNTTAHGSNAPQEKRMRTTAQKKIDSQLLYAIYHQRGEAKEKGIPPLESRLQFDEKHRVLVTIRARVTKTL